MNQENKSTEENKFTQLCVWPSVTLSDNKTGAPTKSNIAELVKFFKEDLNARIKFDCEVKTLPDLDKYGDPIPETGGRSDLFFYVHSDDISHFAMPRLKMGIRWWEDVIFYNDNSRHLYTPEFIEARPVTW